MSKLFCCGTLPKEKCEKILRYYGQKEGRSGLFSVFLISFWGSVYDKFVYYVYICKRKY